MFRRAPANPENTSIVTGRFGQTLGQGLLRRIQNLAQKVAASAEPNGVKLAGKLNKLINAAKNVSVTAQAPVPVSTNVMKKQISTLNANLAAFLAKAVTELKNTNFAVINANRATLNKINNSKLNNNNSRVLGQLKLKHKILASISNRQNTAVVDAARKLVEAVDALTVAARAATTATNQGYLNALAAFKAVNTAGRFSSLNINSWATNQMAISTARQARPA